MKLLLSQIIGHAQDGKKKVMAMMTATYHKLQKQSSYTGLQRTYRPYNDEGEKLPPETKVVQTTVVKELLEVVGVDCMGPLATYIDECLTLNTGNAVVKVDLIVDGKVMISQVPPTFLMELKKLLVGVHTMVADLPTQDPGTTWNWNANAGVYQSDSTFTVRTKKTKQVLLKAAATDKHPAQAEVYEDDIPVGDWLKVDYTGAIPLPTRNALVARVEAVQKAVDDALSECNAQKVDSCAGGGSLVEYLFQDVLS